jgi:antibiotic biosynthesis monooxygenase (ABM) superfamily enzyme
MGAWSAADAGTGPQTRDAQLPGGVTEVILEQVRADMDDAYRQWLEKVQRIQAGFPGYRGVSLQPPIPNVQPRWTTLLRFDTPEHLDAWLRSPARRELLDEAAPWTESLQSHRLVAPFAGWFPRLAPSGAPARWKQTMIVLLVLYPIVMLEVRFLNPFLVGLPAAVATFIGNAISVALVAWPMVPMALRCLDWWVLPRSPARRVTAAAGATVVSAGYALLVIFFWLWL